MLSSFWLRVFANEFDRELVIHFIYACKYPAAYLNSRVKVMWKLSRSLEEIAVCDEIWINTMAALTSNNNGRLVA